MEELDDRETEESSDDDDDESSDEDESEEEEQSIDENKNEERRLLSFWKTLDPPITEESIVNKWYGCIFTNKKKSHLYVGKAIRRFLVDEDGQASALEIDCLRPHVGSDTFLDSVPPHLTPDVDVFSIHDIVDGPLEVLPLKAGKWNVPAYLDLKKKFEIDCQIEREALRAV